MDKIMHIIHIRFLIKIYYLSEMIASLFYAQPVPKALSVISVISV